MKVLNLRVLKRKIAGVILMKVGMNYQLCKTRVDKYEPRHRESISFLYNNNSSNYRVRSRKKIKRIKKLEKEKY